MKAKIKCAIYARYSSSNQKETSIEDQIRICREFADKRGWKILEEHIYIDKATSGTSIKNRKALQQLIKIIESSEAPFEYILIEDTSRLARNTIDALRLANKFYFYGIKIYFISQNIDTGNETVSELFIAISGIIDDIFIKNLSQKTRRGMEGRFLAGFSTGGRIYGYRSIPVYGDKTDKYGNKEIIGYKIIIDSKEAEVVREIFRLYSQGKSTKQIANILNKKLKEHSEPRPPKGEWWSASTIRSILKNKKYTGTWEWGKTSAIKNKETGQIKRKKNDKSEWRKQSREELRIIDQELWEKVQNLIEKRRPKRGHFSSAKSKYSKHLLTGILKCRNCDSSIVIVNSKKIKVSMDAQEDTIKANLYVKIA